jgi:RNA polymerase sigma-70 factor (ECF subfamily)
VTTLHPPPAPPSDDELIRRSMSEPEHFAELCDNYAGDIHRYLARRVGDAADDLVSETFLAAFRQRSSYRSVHEHARPWLYGIATNLLRRHARTEQRRYRALARSHDASEWERFFEDEAAERLDATALRAPLAAALADLAKPDRDVLLLFAWAQLGYQEIAEALTIPVGTVRSRLNRSRRLMRTALAGHDLTIEETS